MPWRGRPGGPRGERAAGPDRDGTGSNGLVPADLVVQDGGGRVGVHAQFRLQRLGAGPVLHEGQVRLALPAVAAHQPPVRVFPAGIAFGDPPAERRAGGVPPGAEVQIAQAAERVEVGEPETIAGERRPLLVEVVGEEVAAVEAIGVLVLPGGPASVARLLATPAVFHAALA